MVYTQCKDECFENMRELFVETVKEIFDTTDRFLDTLQNEEYVYSFEFLSSVDGECYIIDTIRGEYINWYKFTHIGRDIHIATDLWIEDVDDIKRFFKRFLSEFKGV